jgi:hypothetical protein
MICHHVAAQGIMSCYPCTHAHTQKKYCTFYERFVSVMRRFITTSFEKAKSHFLTIRTYRSSNSSLNLLTFFIQHAFNFFMGLGGGKYSSFLFILVMLETFELKVKTTSL